MKFYALDIETESLDAAHPEYALQPWRVKESKARISLVCSGSFMQILPNAEDDFVVFFLETDKNRIPEKYTWTWNGAFDIAFLIASGVDCSKVKWLDAMSLFKWAVRSQKTDPPDKKDRFSWSLGNAAKILLKNWEYYNEFLNTKEEMLSDPEYWQSRCQLDTEATLLIGEKLWTKLTPKQQRNFLIEQEALYPTAMAWVNGCRYNMEGSEKLASHIGAKREELLNQLDVSKKVLSSPKQLSKLIYEKWQIPFDEISRTPKGGMSAGKGAIQLLIEKYGNKYPKLLQIQEYRGLKSKYDKFVAGPKKIQAYLGKDVFHHNLRLNSTYTGRCTVSSKSRKKFPIGLPFHQIPKQGDYRKFILPPEGHCFIVADVDSQETKLMTDASDDLAFLKIYAEGLNPHAYTASKISGAPYKEIIEGKESDDRLATIYKAGKITNLGGNYRMGAKTLWKNAHVQWGLTPTEDECKNWRKVWRSTYKGVIQQWDSFIQKARHNGYAETLAGRRFYISEWGRYKWSSESSAIMVPIQGSGADMKYLAIAVMRQKFPGLTFWGEIHDEIIYTVSFDYLNEIAQEEASKIGKPEADYNLKNNISAISILCKEVKKTLDNLPYKKAWGWEPRVPFTWTVSYGLNWKEQTEV